jgi:hypothetical protein
LRKNPQNLWKRLKIINDGKSGKMSGNLSKAILQKVSETKGNFPSFITLSNSDFIFWKT